MKAKLLTEEEIKGYLQILKERQLNYRRIHNAD